MTNSGPAFTHLPDIGGLTENSGLVPQPFETGRFANRVNRSGSGLHAGQAVRETLKSSFVLTLLAGGRATLCRGWKFLSFNDGPQMRSSESLSEQFGYSGTWRSSDQTVAIDLRQDDSICPKIGYYSSLVPQHAEHWHLRCALYAPERHPWLSIPFLACRLEGGPQFGEDEPHAVALADGHPVILLAPGNGLDISAQYDPTGAKPATSPRVDLAREPIGDREWESP